MELVGDVTLRQIETVDTQTGEVKVTSAYSAPVRVTVAGALPRTDIGFHAVAEDNAEGHDTAIKGSVTDGMKRALRSFGVQFGNGLYGDQQPVGGQPRPERVPVQPTGRSGEFQTSRPIRQTQSLPSTGSRGRSNESQVQTLRKQLIEIAVEQGFDEDGVRTAVVDRMGKSIDDLTAAELGRLSRPPPTSSGRCSRRRRPSPPVETGHGIERGCLSFGAAPLSHLQEGRTTW